MATWIVAAAVLATSPTLTIFAARLESNLADTSVHNICGIDQLLPVGSFAGLTLDVALHAQRVQAAHVGCVRGTAVVMMERRSTF